MDKQCCETCKYWRGVGKYYICWYVDQLKGSRAQPPVVPGDRIHYNDGTTCPCYQKREASEA